MMSNHSPDLCVHSRKRYLYPGKDVQQLQPAQYSWMACNGWELKAINNRSL